MKLTKSQWYRAGLILLLVVLVTAGLVMVRTTRRLAAALERGSPMLETLSTIGRVRLLAQELELARPDPGTPQGSPAAVRYATTIRDLQATVAELKQQAAGSPVQLERAMLLDGLLREQLAAADRERPLPPVKQKGRTQAKPAAATPLDLGGIRTILDRMEGDEKSAIAAWREGVREAIGPPTTAAFAAVAAAAVVAVIAYFLVLVELSRRTSTERLLRESQLRFGMLTDRIRVCSLIVLDASGRVVDWNTGAERMFGYSADEIKHKNFSKFFTREQAYQRVPENRLETATNSGQVSNEEVMVRRDASAFPVRDVVYAVQDDAGRLSGFVAVVQDITEEHRSREEVAKLGLSLEHSTDLVAITRADGTIEHANRALLTATGYSRDELVGKPLDMLRGECPPPAAGTQDAGGQALAIRKKNGDQLLVSETVAPVVDRAGNTTHLVVTAKDITTQRHLETKLSFLTQHDPLTGLFNRTYFQVRAREEIDRNVGGAGRSAVVISIDRFKYINDVFGSNAGNIVLKQVAECLKEAIGSRGEIGRLGSDEFGVVLRNAANPKDIKTAMVPFVERMSNSVAIDGRKVFLTLSVGAAFYPADGTDADMLFKNADVALAHAKSAGINQFCFYSAEINTEMSDLVAMEQRLFGALLNDEYHVVYQPYCELIERKVAGAETLIRWTNRELGVVSPSKFIKTLEDTGLIIDVGAWVLKEACMQVRKIDAKIHGFPLAVNLSPAQFRHEYLVEMIKDTIGTTEIDPKRITIEVTESAFLKDLSFAQSVLKQLRKIGVTISIDDFGTGYSSLSYLKKLQVDAVKIDQSFVRDVTSDPDTAAMVTSITSMAKSLGLKTIAEGVETEEQWKVLRLLRCDMGQGFFFSPAMKAEEFERSLA